MANCTSVEVVPTTSLFVSLCDGSVTACRQPHSLREGELVLVRDTSSKLWLRTHFAAGAHASALPIDHRLLVKRAHFPLLPCGLVPQNTTTCFSGGSAICIDLPPDSSCAVTAAVLVSVVHPAQQSSQDATAPQCSAPNPRVQCPTSWAALVQPTAPCSVVIDGKPAEVRAILSDFGLDIRNVSADGEALTGVVVGNGQPQPVVVGTTEMSHRRTLCVFATPLGDKPFPPHSAFASFFESLQAIEAP